MSSPSLEQIKTFTPLELQELINALLDEVLKTGNPLEISRDGQLFQILPLEHLESDNKLDDLEPHPEVYVGDPDDLVNISWEHELSLDLP
ncbi:hypothetical protein Lepto7376_2256 [[Leptolyngbya] sp. PCC 7376]|nr:hypothetical protein Lepto7376_2256 [[Leptolyngbya] sp. PCC 7376]